MRRSCKVVALLLAIVTFASAQPSAAQVVVVRIVRPPPPLPIYVQPAIPGPDYYWTPGYWAWGPDDYYLGAGNVGAGAFARLAVDTRLLGLARRRRLRVALRLLGTARRLLYGRCQLWLRLHRAGYYGGYWSGRVFTYNTAVTNVGIGAHHQRLQQDRDQTTRPSTT